MLQKQEMYHVSKKILTALVAFACTGTLYASAALPMGTHSMAEGEGAIATGKNSIAKGTGAVATGDNLTGEKIQNILKENEDTLKQIETMKEQVRHSESDFKKKNEIYIRVEAAKKKIEANNKRLQEELYPCLEQAKGNYNGFKPGYDQSKNEINRRLSLIARLDFNLLATDPEQGLDTLAKELKEKSEEGYTFSKDIDFYKNYIRNYVKAKGDLAENKAKAALMGSPKVTAKTFANPTDYSISHDFLEGYMDLSIRVTGNNLHEGDGFYTILGRNIYLGDKTSTVSKAELEAWAEEKTKIAAAALKIIDGQKSIFVDDTAKEQMKLFVKSHLDYTDAIYHAKYEQLCYREAETAGRAEDAMTHLKKKIEYEEQAKTIRGTFFENYDTNRPTTRIRKAMDEWKKANVEDIENSNTLSVHTLEDLYEESIKEKEEKLGTLADDVGRVQSAIDEILRQNKQLQPTEEELEQARQMEAAKQKLDAGKQALEEAIQKLTLKDLTDVGTNALAYGTNSLVTGKNAVGIGADELVTGEDGVGIGRKNTVSGTQSVAIGTENTVGGNNSGALGINNSVLSDGSFVIGKNNNINKEAKSNFIFGSDIVISGSVSDSVVLGSQSTLSAPAKVENVTPFGVVSVGAAGKERQIQNVAPGRIEASSTDAVNGSQLYRLSELIKNNTNTGAGAGNVTGADKTVIKDIAKESVKVVDGTNTTVTETTDKDGNKNYAVNVEANGKIEENNNNLVTGGTVYKAIVDKIQDKSLIKADNKTISLDKDGEADVIDFSHRVNGKTEGRVITGVVTDPENLYSAANVSYVNTSISGVIQEMTSGMNRLEKGMNDAGAGAAALSALEYDEIEPGQKWQIAAGVGNYKGSTAYALGAKYHLNKDISFHMGTTIGNGNNMVNGGFSIALGKGYGKTGAGADVWERMASMQKEIDVLKEQNQKLMEALDKVNALHSRDSSEKENTSEAHRM